jgi:hypothetical protein
MTLANILTASLLLPGVVGPDMSDDRHAGPSRRGLEPSPQIAVWTNRTDDVFERGDPMTVFLRTDVDGYVTLFRVNTDGQVRVLFPARPSDDNYIRGVQPHVVPGTREGYTLRVQEYPGEGFLFAIVTLDPIAIGPFARGPEWDYVALGLDQRITGDPYVLFSDLLAALVPETYPDYAYAVTPYYVGARHDYPRFLCYQCHAYVSPAVWNPYAHSCIRTDEPRAVWWRYSHGVYGGTVVVGPPRRLPPGFVVTQRAPRASPVGPRSRGTPTAGSTTGRRPAPIATAPPTRRSGGKPEAGRRTTAAAPTGTPSESGATSGTPPRRTEATTATPRRAAPAPAAPDAGGSERRTKPKI